MMQKVKASSGKSCVIELSQKENEWQKTYASITINPELNRAENEISVYVWNVNKNNFFGDNVIVSYSGKK